jgi:uncharacterized protein YndB with AHSA1/START domain
MNHRESDTSKRELVVARTFNAPRELVFQAWTDPRRVAHWWGPRGFTTTTSEMTVSPGGTWRFVMHGPDGRDYPNRIIYREVVRPERLVYSHDGDDEKNPVQFEVTVTFEDDGGKTRLTLRSLFPTAEMRDMVVREYGAEEGGKQTLERFGEYLSTISAEKNSPVKEVAFTRVLNAPRELVFQAWTDPRHLAKWWGPHHFTNPVCEADARPGGRILIHMQGPDGTVHPMTGEYREIDEPKKVVFFSAVPNDKGGALFEVLTTVTLTEAEGGKTRLDLLARVLYAQPEAFPALSGMEEGWKQTLERLETHVTSV